LPGQLDAFGTGKWLALPKFISVFFLIRPQDVDVKNRPSGWIKKVYLYRLNETHQALI
jgi:hypothetical protein